MAVLSKVLTPTDVGSALCWPMSWLHFLPPFTNQVTFEAMDSNNVVWRFTCGVRGRGPHPKPVLLGSSWLPFVRVKGIAPNDMLLLYLDPDESVRIRVRKHKTIRLFGQNIIGYLHEE